MLSFSEWLVSATERNKINLYSISKSLGIAHSTLYSKVKSDSFTDRDIQDISSVLNDYSYIDSLKDVIQGHIKNIEGGESQ